MKAQKLAASSGQCAEVTPFLFVSGREVAGDEATLRRHGITHVVNCAGLHVPNHFEEEVAAAAQASGWRPHDAPAVLGAFVQ